MALQNKTFSELITFTRSSERTRVGPTGLIETVPADQPRFDYDPVTLNPRGILIERQSTNFIARHDSLIPWAEQQQAERVNQQRFLEPNFALAPDGTMSADRLTDSLDGDIQRIFISSGQTDDFYCFSVFLKKSTVGNYAGIQFTGIEGLVINLTTGAAEFVGASLVNHTVEQYADGWWRVSITADATGGNPIVPWIYLANDSFSNSFVGEGRNVLVWGMQLDSQVNRPRSLIKTVGAAETASAEIAGIDISPWFREQAGTIYVKAKVIADNLTGEDAICCFGTSNYWGYFRLFGTGTAQVLSRSNNATAASVQAQGSYGQEFTAAFYIDKNGGVGLSIDGGAAQQVTGAFDLDIDIPTLWLGSRTGQNGTYANGILIKDLKFYPKAVDAAELQYLSANGKLSTEA